MADLRKQVFQAIEQPAFHYQGDKDDLEKLIDVVVELIQKREAEARIDELKMARGVDSQFSSADIVNHLDARLSQLKNEGKGK